MPNPTVPSRRTDLQASVGPHRPVWDGPNLTGLREPPGSGPDALAICCPTVMGDMPDLVTAQAELRYGYRSASVGQIYAGAVWLVSGATWIWVGTLPGVLVLVGGGFLIYPVTSLVCRLLGNPGSVSPANPLREASITIPIVGALGIPVAGAAALYEIEWFFPAFMVVMGAH